MTLHDILHVLIINWKTILKLTIGSGIVIFLYLLLISPVTYNAPVTILPPAESDQISGIGSLLSGANVGDFLTGRLAPGNSQLFTEILKSRTAAEYVVKKHRLIEYYGADNISEATKELQESLNLDLNKEGIITLSVNISSNFIPLIFSDKDSIKNLSANISNSYVEALDKINREKVSYRAKRAREFVEAQLMQTKSQLDSAEVRLMQFQKKNKTISLPEQLTSAIESAAKLKAEIVNTEIEIGILEPNLKADNQVLIALRKKLSELQKEYKKFDIGADDYLVAFSEAPELGMELAKLLREVKIRNEVYLLLQQQYYKEKIQENRDVPTIDVLDEAIAPRKKSTPKTIFVTIVGSIFACLLVSMYFVLKEKKLTFFNTRKSN